MEDPENLRRKSMEMDERIRENDRAFEQEKSRIILLPESEELPLDELVERLRERLKRCVKEQNLRRANVEELNKRSQSMRRSINFLFLWKNQADWKRAGSKAGGVERAQAAD